MRAIAEEIRVQDAKTAGFRQPMRPRCQIFKEEISDAAPAHSAP